MRRQHGGALRGERFQDRRAREHRRRIDRVEAVARRLVHAEDQLARLLRHRQRGAERRDPARAGVEVRHLEESAASDIQPVYVRDAVAVGHEVQALGVRPPLRVDVLAVGEPGDRLDAARRHVQQRQPVIARLQVLQ